ncbi:MAG: putative viral replication protein [Circoviridae sp.]|nr:MAG: putative viral replication protein [Circoviridae sp.]
MKRKLETLETEDGNTNSPPRRAVPSKRWIFTYNNYPEDALETLETVFQQFKCEYIFGQEVGEECGTPHLQGYIEAPMKVRPIEKFKLAKQISWRKARGSAEDNIRYCSKDGSTRHSHKLRPIRPLKLLCPNDMYDWQTEILDLIKEEPDDRTINWYWSHEGNIGKTTFSKYLVAKCGATLLSGKGADVRNGVIEYCKQNNGRTPEFVVFPIPRSFSQEYISYEAIENIKDMFFYSGKYEGGSVCGNCPHVIVFANHPPCMDKLSTDRWNIVNIDESVET